ncbi:MAG: hypothetical protein JWR10_2847 [Rubritepida sp.]|nr:hypothetical protein [Rubritepida sp.]
MDNRRVTLVVGATGAAASRVLEQGRAMPGQTVIGLSRNKPAGDDLWLTADLDDPQRLTQALSAHPDISHVVYASRAPHDETGVEDVPGNLRMLRNLVDAAEASLPRLAHIHLIHGAKWYGMHLGAYRTPSREDDPRHPSANFYYEQQDFIAGRQRGKAWVWSTSRPNFVLDVAPGRARNMVSTLGAYAAICRELDEPFDFPGTPGTWDALHEVTDAKLLADGVLWMLGENSCANRAFNMTNGDAFRWCDLWPFLAEQFGCRPGGVASRYMTFWSDGKEAVWERIRARHGLALPLGQVANWGFFDFFMGMDYDVLCSMTAARQAGFQGFVNSWTMFSEQIAGYRAARILPPL